MPRSVCLKKASNISNIDSDNVVNSLIRPSDYSSESSSSNSSVVSDKSDGLTLRNLNRRNMEFAEEYGFKLRGDSPVIISFVVSNSLADVSLKRDSIFIEQIKYAFVLDISNDPINIIFQSTQSFFTVGRTQRR